MPEQVSFKKIAGIFTLIALVGSAIFLSTIIDQRTRLEQMALDADSRPIFALGVDGNPLDTFTYKGQDTIEVDIFLNTRGETGPLRDVNSINVAINYPGNLTPLEEFPFQMTPEIEENFDTFENKVDGNTIVGTFAIKTASPGFTPKRFTSSELVKIGSVVFTVQQETNSSVSFDSTKTTLSHFTQGETVEMPGSQMSLRSLSLRLPEAEVGEAYMYIEPSSTTMTTGQTREFTVYANIPADKPASGSDIIMEFNPSHISVNSEDVVKGDAFSLQILGASQDLLNQGTLKYSVGIADGESGVHGNNIELVRFTVTAEQEVSETHITFVFTKGDTTTTIITKKGDPEDVGASENILGAVSGPAKITIQEPAPPVVNNPPEVEILEMPATIVQNTETTFRARALDPDGTTVEVNFIFISPQGDQETLSGRMRDGNIFDVRFTPTRVGQYTLRVSATDTPPEANPITTTKEATFTVTSPPEPVEIVKSLTIGGVRLQGRNEGQNALNNVTVQLVNKANEESLIARELSLSQQGGLNVPLDTLGLNVGRMIQMEYIIYGENTLRATGEISIPANLARANSEVQLQNNNVLYVGDFNGDNIINAVDYDMFLSEFGSTGPNKADFNNDGVVNSLDYDVILRNFFRCGPENTSVACRN